MSGAYEEWLHELPETLRVMASNEKRCGRDGQARELEVAASEIERLRSEVVELRHVVTMAKLPTDPPLASRAFPNPFKVII